MDTATNAQDLSGRRALVAGARRIGAAVALRIAASGADVAVSYRSSRTAAEQLCERIRAAGARTAAIRADLSTEQGARRAVAGAAGALGGLDFAVSLASGYGPAPLAETTARRWDEAMADARASFLFAREAAAVISRNPGPARGQIVLFTDWAALHAPYRGYVPYMTAKAAIAFMTRALAAELAPEGIQVNAIAPGPTERPPDVSGADWEHAVRAAPLGRESAASDIAAMVAALLSTETVTGEVIRVDSGRHLAGPGT